MMPGKSVAKKNVRRSAPDQVDEQLERYRSMRDFRVTAEPAGGKKGSGSDATALHFCIQKHAASHLHYDFRLQWNGVLKSWACAKGPSYVVADRRLAVQVEDHPLEYGGFEGIIPAGQYGGGTVMLWDQGTWAPQEGHKDIDAGLRDGSLKFTMDGERMKGKWTLVRMKGKAASEAKPNWLLIKEHDAFERPADAAAITEEAQTSVITGRTMEQIAANQDHVWNSKETAKPGQAWYRQETPAGGPAAPSKGAKKAGKSQRKESDSFAAELKKLPKEVQPGFVKPQLALEAENPPATGGWVHELKLDGYRMQARKDGGSVQMLTRSGLDWTDRMRGIAEEVAKLPAEAVTLDGEVVVLNEAGTTNFADLQAAFQEGAKKPLTFFAFDLLHLDGHSTRDLPLVERKALLARLLRSADAQTLQVSEHLETDGEQMFRKACELRAEGILSKKAHAPYTGGRSGAWLKSKCLHEQEFVIGGWTLPGKGKVGGPGLGALLLGYYDESKKLVYAGRTGTGFTQKSSALIRKQLESLSATQSPFAAMSSEARRGAQWVEPSLVAQVRFATWTAEGQLRQAAFLGLREDKAASEVRREGNAPQPKSSGSKATTRVAGKELLQKDPVASPARKEPLPVRLTHPGKILDEESKLTKQELAEFYWAVADRMLPHIADRPLSLVRCPEGSEKPCFFQKHVNAMLPAGIKAVEVPDKKTGKVEPYITLNTREALAGLAQIGVLEIHPWGSRNETLELPDQLTIDLDPDDAISWADLAKSAQEIRERLRKIGLASWVKTTGGKGLHVVIPIKPRLEWPQIKLWSHAFVMGMERDDPKRYLTKMSKAARSGKIYLDYLRNERGATAVAPYSPRARRGVGVAMPLAWTELKSAERPSFQVSNSTEWAGRLKRDIWSGLLTCEQDLPG